MNTDTCSINYIVNHPAFVSLKVEGSNRHQYFIVEYVAEDGKIKEFQAVDIDAIIRAWSYLFEEDMN